MEDSPRRVTQRDIADRTGHSVKTVNLALNNSPRVGPAAKKAIEDVAVELGYVFHRERSGRLGLVAGAINHPYYSDVIDAIVQAASLEAGYGVDIRSRAGSSAPSCRPSPSSTSSAPKAFFYSAPDCRKYDSNRWSVDPGRSSSSTPTLRRDQAWSR